jgi:hypothetical protein
MKVVTEWKDGCGATLFEHTPKQHDMERWEVRELADQLNALVAEWDARNRMKRLSDILDQHAQIAAEARALILKEIAGLPLVETR